MQTARLYDTGTALRGTVRDEAGTLQDLSTATTKEFVLRKPNGTELTKSATLISGGFYGQMYYIITSGDLDSIGRWEVDVHLIYPSGDWNSTIGSFLVY